MVKVSIACRAGTNEVYSPTWRHYEQLHFLRDSITPVKTRPTTGVSIISLEPEVIPSVSDEDDENDELVLNPTPKSAKSVVKIKKKIEDKVLEKSHSFARCRQQKEDAHRGRWRQTCLPVIKGNE